MRGYRTSVVAFEPLGMNSNFYGYMSYCDDIDKFNGKGHIFIMWFYDVVIDLDRFALSSRALLWKLTFNTDWDDI